MILEYTYGKCPNKLYINYTKFNKKEILELEYIFPDFLKLATSFPGKDP
jgi:hypothetical protein